MLLTDDVGLFVFAIKVKCINRKSYDLEEWIIGRLKGIIDPTAVVIYEIIGH